MSSKVCISPHLTNIPNIQKIAVGLAIFHDTGKYPDFLGHYGKFENNQRAMNSLISKMHIALYRADWTLKSWKNRNGYNRTSDNFIIYVKHFFADDYYQILDIVSPEAHKRINSILSSLIEKAEQFHSLRDSDLHQLETFSNNHCIAKEIKLTP
ncbi:type II toxin-antitoxin system YafO family toxin [[Pasteurella] aerogenes]|nr:type II toxin-antitoxin system YafO family toxin [[Pasteurella] aerogenes]MDY4480482.1 type II toxin-antitoxin system YafO family toxin [[Pasteurella] aerogenes]